MHLYILIIIVAVILYEFMFRRDFYRKAYLTLIYKTKSSKYAKFDKTKQYQYYMEQKKFLDFCRQHNLLKAKTYKTIIEDLKVCSVKDPELYIANFLNFCPIFIITGGLLAILSFLSSLTVRIVSPESEYILLFFAITNVIGIVMVLGSPLIFPLLKANIQLKKTITISMVESDYYILFNHLYYYYAIPGQTYLLAQVLEKFTTNCSAEMRGLVDRLMTNSKESEHVAIEDIKLRYAQSIKIVQLMDKLEKCIDGNQLGPEYLKGLYNEIIEEEDFKREQAEARKQYLYIAVLCGTILAVMFSQITGMSIEIMF